MQRSLSDVVGLKHKILELLNEPTLDKACSTVATTLLTAVVILAFTEQDIESMFWLSIFAVGIGIFGYAYKKFNLPLQVLDDERKKSNIKFDHLIKNPKLDETEIRLDLLGEVHNEMTQLRTHFEQLTNTLINRISNVEVTVDKVNDIVNGSSDTPPTEPVKNIPPNDSPPSPDKISE